ncbi:protein transport protein Sec31A-like [Glossophaga mutica]
MGVISDLSEPIDVTLHRLVHGQLHLIFDSEVISSKMGIVQRTCRDLSPQDEVKGSRSYSYAGMEPCSESSHLPSYRYHKLIWGPHKMDSKGNLSGVLIAGGENGNIILYDPSKIMAGEKEVVIAQNDKHTGPVRALDVNIFQTNLVASGANESEIYIWDLNNFATPMTPGAKTQVLQISK